MSASSLAVLCIHVFLRKQQMPATCAQDASGIVPVAWVAMIYQAADQLALSQHLAGAHGLGHIVIIKQAPTAGCLPLNESIMTRIAAAAVVQHHPPKAIHAVPPIIQGTLGAVLGHGELHGVLHTCEALLCTMLLDILHDMQTV